MKIAWYLQHSDPEFLVCSLLAAAKSGHLHFAQDYLQHFCTEISYSYNICKIFVRISFKICLGLF